MSAMQAYVFGVPVSGLEIVSSALVEVFGEGGVEIVELQRDNLRFNIRSSAKKESVVLVLLDSESAEVCSDVGDALFKMDKYHTYKNDKGLIEYLNSRYELNIQADEEASEVQMTELLSEDGVSELREQFSEALAEKDSLIRNLQARIAELQDFLDNPEEGNSEVEGLKEEILSLKSDLSDRDSKISLLNDEMSSLRAEKADSEDIAKKLELTSKDLEATSSKLAEERNRYSIQSAVLREKEKRVSDLELKLETAESKAKEVESSLNRELTDLRSRLDASAEEVKSLRESLVSQKEESVKEFASKLSKAEESLEAVNSELDRVKSDNASLSAELSNSEKTVASLTERLEKSDSDLVALNKQLLDMETKLSYLEGEGGKDDISSLMTKYNDLYERYAKISTSSFGKLYESSAISSQPRVSVIGKPGYSTENLSFVFSGSTESRKTTYKAMLNSMRGVNQKKFLIVDVVSETFVDYVFEIEKLKPGLEWFVSGGGVMNYISDTKYFNIKVLSAGVSFVNDSYFLMIDWYKRLEELSNSGYDVVLYCGDLSNTISRVLFESFSQFGRNTVYCLGNAVSSRSLVLNSRGIKGVKESTCIMTGYDRRMQRFYDMAKKLYKELTVDSKPI